MTVARLPLVSWSEQRFQISPQVAKALLALLSDSGRSTNVRGAAMFALASSGDRKKRAPIIRRYLDDSDPDMVEWAQLVLRDLQRRAGS